jgi:hypothetical protein
VKYLLDAQIARGVLSELRGQAIIGTDGKSLTADGATLTYFSGTQAQRDDHNLYVFRIGTYDKRVSDNGSANIVVPQQEGMLRAGCDAARIGRLSTANGSTGLDYTIEETLIGGGAKVPKIVIKTGAGLAPKIIANTAEQATAKTLAREEIRTAEIAMNASRDSDITTGLRPAEEVNKLFAEKGYTAPFTNDTYVTVSVSRPGMPANMLVSDTGQAQAIDAGKPAFGGFSTPDLVPSQTYARDTLAITPAMKPDVSKFVPIETTGRPIVLIEGKIAPQEPVAIHSGNGNQIFYDYPAGSNRGEYLRSTGPTQSLPMQSIVMPKINVTVSTPMPAALPDPIDFP